jgi:hypothetical protein
MISQSTLLWLPNKVLDFVLMLFGIPYIAPDIRSIIVGIIAFVIYAHLVRFILDYIKKLAGLGNNGGMRR